MQLLEIDYSPYIETGILGLPSQGEDISNSILKSIKGAGWFVVTANYMQLQLQYLYSAYLCASLLMPVGLIYLITKFTGFGEKFADRCLDKALKIFKSDVKVATIATILGAVAVFSLSFLNLISAATAALITVSVRAASFALGVTGVLIPKTFNAYMGAFLKALGLDGNFADVNAQSNMGTRKTKFSSEAQDALYFNETIAESTGAVLGVGATLSLFASAAVPATIASLTAATVAITAPLALSAGIGSQACRSLLLYKRKVWGDGTDTAQTTPAPAVDNAADNAARPARRERPVAA